MCKHIYIYLIIFCVLSCCYCIFEVRVRYRKPSFEHHGVSDAWVQRSLLFSALYNRVQTMLQLISYMISGLFYIAWRCQLSEATTINILLPCFYVLFDIAGGKNAWCVTLHLRANAIVVSNIVKDVSCYRNNYKSRYDSQLHLLCGCISITAIQSVRFM